MDPGKETGEMGVHIFAFTHPGMGEIGDTYGWASQDPAGGEAISVGGTLTAAHLTGRKVIMGQA